MNIGVVGGGHVGATVASCLSENHEVIVLDKSRRVVDDINDDVVPVDEPGLSMRYVIGTTDVDMMSDRDIVFICVPTHDDGYTPTHLQNAVADIDDVTGPEAIIVVKSTTTPGTVDMLDNWSRSEVVSNPEFLRQGHGAEDFGRRVVIGGAYEETVHRVGQVYDRYSDDGVVFHYVKAAEAELAKVGTNAFLAATISLANDFGNVCKQFDVDTAVVEDLIDEDDRISVMRSGLGWGGDCLPDDIVALRDLVMQNGYHPPMFSAAIDMNSLQVSRLIEILESKLDLKSSRIAVLGLSYKPGTDSMKNSPAIDVLDELKGTDLVAYDPAANGAVVDHRPWVTTAGSAQKAVDSADASVFVTAWPEFSSLSFPDGQIVVDGCRVINPPENIDYEGLTW